MKTPKNSRLVKATIALFATAAMSLVWVILANPGTLQADSPGTPTELTAHLSWFPSLVGEGIDLNWKAPEGTVTGYQILRLQSGCDDTLSIFVEDTGSTDTTYTDTDVEDGITYTYRVKAINGETTGEHSDEASLKYSANMFNPTITPSTPSNMVVPENLEAWNTDSGIQLQWETSGEQATGYKIMRRPYRACERFEEVLVADTNSTTTHWMDRNTDNKANYEYRVAGVNDSGETLPSESAHAQRFDPARHGYIGTVSSRAVFAGGMIIKTGKVFSLEIDEDPSTVDYTVRSEVTRADDSSDADECEISGFGIDREIRTVESEYKEFEWRVGGTNCRVGTYHDTTVLRDRNNNIMLTTTGTFRHDGSDHHRTGPGVATR